MRIQRLNPPAARRAALGGCSVTRHRAQSSQQGTALTGNEVPALKEWGITLQALLEGRQQVSPACPTGDPRHILIAQCSGILLHDNYCLA